MVYTRPERLRILLIIMKSLLKWRHCSASDQKDLLLHLEELLFRNLWYCLNKYIFGFYYQTRQMTLWIICRQNKSQNFRKEWRLGSTRYKEIYFSPQDYVDKKTETKHKWKNIALVTYPFIIGSERCGPNLYSHIFWEHVFLRLVDCFITELNPKILASFLLRRCYIMNELK